MRHDYDIFEKFPDGSTIWRVCMSGRYETERKMRELTEQSKNEFYAIDIIGQPACSPQCKECFASSSEGSGERITAQLSPAASPSISKYLEAS